MTGGATSEEYEVPVLIVGGSLVGLTTSVLLSARGVPHLMIERHRGTAIHPRAAAFHQRTMEIYRSIGMQAEVEQAAAEEFVQNGSIMSAESLCGPELQYFFRSVNDGVEHLSPTTRLFITQIGLEPLLRERATRQGAEHRYATELVDFEQDGDEVRSRIRPRDGGPEQLVRSKYLVAADGAHSSLRRRLGIPMHGRGSFAECITIYFRADVAPMLGDRNLSVVYVNHPELLGFLRFSMAGDSGFLAVFAVDRPDGSRTTDVAGEAGADATRHAAFVRTALGCPPDTRIEIEDVQAWSASADCAERFQDGRVLLVGDAAHVMPPTGGFGGNTGVADAHNLAWKLAMVLDGTAGPDLISTYDAERRPIAAITVEQAYTRYALRVDTTLPRDDMAPVLDDVAIELGSCYRSAAIDEAADGPDAPPLDDARTPSGRLGTRAPHIVVGRGGTAVPVHDVLGPGFVLLAGAAGGHWCAAATAVAAALGFPLEAWRVAPDGDLTDPDGAFPAAFGVGPEGAVIVRPDGVIAWRSVGDAADPRAAVEEAMAHLLMRQPSGDRAEARS
jgi:2-polyprenyl-6-methoxyphenol hydroxylase-like FAD-dependent oxidoreductase